MEKNLSEHLKENTADKIAGTVSDTPVFSQSGTPMEYVAPKSEIKGTVKDSVFRNLFENRKYALQLYKAIHPEDSNVTEADIGNVTINNVLTDQEYNDLGMTVRGKLLLLLEAQSTWSMNIIVRLLLYLAHTWNEHIETTRQNRYGSKRLELPQPELYVIFTGERKKRPKWINLSKEFFKGDKTWLDVNVRVLYGDENGAESNDIISQYVQFTKVYHKQMKLHGRTKEAVLETIRICRDRNVLQDYLASHEKEVVDIMMALFDQKKAVEQYGYEKEQQGIKLGEQRGKQETALALFEMGMPVETIAKAVKVGIDVVQQWLSGSVAKS